MALPILGAARMVLWTSPPGPVSVIGTYNDWIELLALHEDTHIEHLLRPSATRSSASSRACFRSALSHSRRHAGSTKGYATLVEGKLTGFGRPNGDLRAAILRQRARAGTLPTYARSSRATRRAGWGCRWLTSPVPRIWSGSSSVRARTASGTCGARMMARADRSFDAAFAGVFGEPPARLYDRFTAELTWRAMEAERRLEPVAREGALWQDLKWTTGEPALSADGASFGALALRAREAPSRLVVWSTGPDEAGLKTWDERVAKAAQARPRRTSRPSGRGRCPASRCTSS